MKAGENQTTFLPDTRTLITHIRRNGVWKTELHKRDSDRYGPSAEYGVTVIVVLPVALDELYGIAVIVILSVALDEYGVTVVAVLSVALDEYGAIVKVVVLDV